MPKINNNKAVKAIVSNSSAIDINTKEAFVIIDEFLPKHYTKRVIELLPTHSSDYIRHVRCVKKGVPEVVAALKKVALENKRILESLNL